MSDATSLISALRRYVRTAFFLRERRPYSILSSDCANMPAAILLNCPMCVQGCPSFGTPTGPEGGGK